MRSGLKKVINALIILGILGVAALAVSVWRDGTDVSNIAYTPETIPTDWKTYSNTKYHYSFRYPQTMTVVIPGPAPDALKIEESETITLLADDHSDIFAVEVRSEELAQELWKANNMLDSMHAVWTLPLVSYAHTIWEGNKNDPNPNIQGKYVSDLTSFTLNGNRAFHFTLTGSYRGEDIAGGYALREPYTYVITGDDNTKLQINFRSSDQIAKQVLSSFIYQPI